MKRLAPIALAALLLAACGGSSRLSKSQYEQHLQNDGKAVATTIRVLTGAQSSTDLAGVVKKIDAAATAVKTAADDLDSLKPPSDAEADNGAIVTGLRAIETGLAKLKTALSSNPIAAAAIGRSLQQAPAVKAAEKAAADLKSKGYKVGVLGD
jgi:lysozyme family protein